MFRSRGCKNDFLGFAHQLLSRSFLDCEDEEAALENWRETLAGYESSNDDWEQRWEVERQEDYPENFMFTHEGVVFVGINLVSGYIHDEDEWWTRQTADLDWIEEAYYTHRDENRAMVVLAHSSPLYSQNKDFFKSFLKSVEKDYWDMHVVFVHRNSPTESSALEESYDGIENLDVITVLGSQWPPQSVQIDLTSEDEIRVTVQEIE